MKIVTPSSYLEIFPVHKGKGRTGGVGVMLFEEEATEAQREKQIAGVAAWARENSIKVKLYTNLERSRFARKNGFYQENSDWAPSVQEIEAIARKWARQNNLSYEDIIFSAGTAGYLHGIRETLNDIDLFHPDVGERFVSFVDGREVDAGPTTNLTYTMLETEYKEGLQVQTKRAMYSFYSMLNRPKDRARGLVLHLGA